MFGEMLSCLLQCLLWKEFWNMLAAKTWCMWWPCAASRIKAASCRTCPGPGAPGLLSSTVSVCFPFPSTGWFQTVTNLTYPTKGRVFVSYSWESITNHCGSRSCRHRHDFQLLLDGHPWGVLVLIFFLIIFLMSLVEGMCEKAVDVFAPGRKCSCINTRTWCTYMGKVRTPNEKYP